MFCQYILILKIHGRLEKMSDSYFFFGCMHTYTYTIPGNVDAKAPFQFLTLLKSINPNFSTKNVTYIVNFVKKHNSKESCNIASTAV